MSETNPSLFGIGAEQVNPYVIPGDSSILNLVSWEPVITDGKYHLIRAVDVPSGYQQLSLKYTIKIRKVFAAPFTVVLRLGYSDVWAPSLMNSAFIKSDCEEDGDFWAYTARMSPRIRSNHPRRLYFMIRVDSEVNVDTLICIEKQLIEEIKEHV